MIARLYGCDIIAKVVKSYNLFKFSTIFNIFINYLSIINIK